MGTELYSLENIINEVKAQKYTETKSLNDIFIDIIKSMGISAGTLQNQSKRYKFSEIGRTFWIKALGNYTEAPYEYIRKQEYEKVPLSVIHEFMEMVTDTMKNASKSSDEIERALQQIAMLVDYDQRRHKEELTKILDVFCKEYTKSILSHSYLLVEDRETLLRYTQGCLQVTFSQLLRKIDDIAEYFDDERLDEAQESSDGTDPLLTDKIILSDALIDEKLESDPKVETAKRNIYESDSTGSLGKISKKLHFVAAIDRQKQTYQRGQDAELNISPVQRQEYNLAKHKPSKDILAEALSEILS